MHKPKALILDMDGVLWRGSQPIGDLPAIFENIHRKGLGVALATNNAAMQIADHQHKLASFGVHVLAQQIVNSGLAAARFLRARFPQGGSIYVIGETGLRQTLQEAGFSTQPADLETPVAVVVGVDRQFTYERLNQAMQYILGGALFVATNTDNSYPGPNGRLTPGAGTMVAAVQAACSQQPIIIGKPSEYLYQAALEMLGVQPSEALVVGDRVETDILGAQKLGCPTALVLSGVTGAAQARAWQPTPDIIAPDLASVIELL